MNEKIQIAFGLLGGLAIFIYGMNMMSECLQKAAGEKMRSILALLTKNPVMGVLAGALTTAVLQSSSATTVMAVSYTHLERWQKRMVRLSILPSERKRTIRYW